MDFSRGVASLADDVANGRPATLPAELALHITEITEAPEFYPAGVDHQEYYRRNSNQGYCQVVISPKVAKLRQRFADKLRTHQVDT